MPKSSPTSCLNKQAMIESIGILILKLSFTYSLKSYKDFLSVKFWNSFAMAENVMTASKLLSDQFLGH